MKQCDLMYLHKNSQVRHTQLQKVAAHPPARPVPPEINHELHSVQHPPVTLHTTMTQLHAAATPPTYPVTQPASYESFSVQRPPAPSRAPETQLRAKINELEYKLEDAVQCWSELHGHYTGLYHEHQDLEDMCTSLKTKLSVYEKLHAPPAAPTLSNHVSTSLSSLGSPDCHANTTLENKEKDATMSKMTQKCESLEKNLASEIAEKNKLFMDVRSKDGQLRELDKTLRSRDEQIRHMEKTLSELRAKTDPTPIIHRLTADLQARDKHINGLEEDAREKSKQLQNMKSNIQDKEKELASQTKLLSSAHEITSEKNARITELEKMNSFSQDNIKRLQDHLKKLTDQARTETNTLAQQIVEKETDQKKMRSTIESLSREIKDHEQKMGILKKQHEESHGILKKSIEILQLSAEHHKGENKELSDALHESVKNINNFLSRPS